MDLIYKIRQHFLKQKKSYVTNKDIAEIYDKISKTHSTSKGVKLLNNYKNIFSYTQLGKGSKILEIGCGDGFLSKIIPEDTQYLGIDISSKMISESLKKNKEHRKNVFYEKVDANEFVKYAVKNTYDMIIFSFSWKYFDKEFLNQTINLLKENGSLIIIGDFKRNFNTLFELFDEFKKIHKKDLVKINPFNYYPNSTDELNSQLQSSGIMQTIFLNFDEKIDSQIDFLENSGIVHELVSEFGNASELFMKKFMKFIKDKNYVLPKQEYFICIVKK